MDLFDDLDAALALVGAVIGAPLEEAVQVPPPPAPFHEPGDQLDAEEEWLAAGSDGWDEADLEADDATDLPEGHDDLPEPEHLPSDGTGGGPGGSAAHVPFFRPPGPGLIAKILDAEPDDESSAGPRTPRSYTSVPLPTPMYGLRETAREQSGFRMRTLALTLQSMVRVPLRGYEPDIPAVVDRMALAEPLTDVPMRSRLGEPAQIRVMCELWLKNGPYAEDTRLLIHVLHRLYGAERIDLRWFEQSPALGCGRGPVWTWQRCETPARTEATVLVAQGVPDRRSDPEAVHEFATRLAEHDAAVCAVLLGPGPRVPRFRRYPQLLVDD
ncbi:hypothetical protein [Lentzea sp. NPDC059081]|uniref:hypothetical protein n=1 Tax=Lentzea sp. NPDC059081 TaxID=3346719 RepID=UPI00368DDAAF